MNQIMAVTFIDSQISAGLSIRVAFANSNLLNLAAGDLHLQFLLSEFLILNDGIATDIAAQILFGRSFPANLNGTDFVPYYLRHTIHSHRVFLLGGRPGIANCAAAVFEKQFNSRHCFVGTADGFEDLYKSDDLLDRITSSGADLLLVALGNPKQEFWLSQNLMQSGCRLAFGVGALLDFTAGRVKRAPSIIQRMRMEWAFRLMLEPNRLARRYLMDAPIFLLRALFQRLFRTTDHYIG